MPTRSETRYRRSPVAFLVGHPSPDGSEASLDELAHLLDGLGIRVLARIRTRHRDPRAVLGKGKREELAARIASVQDDVLVVVDGSLDPGAHRDFERAVGAPVIDRPGVILRVFERRARTRLAQIEVELARLAYEAPRLREAHAGDDRHGGGGRGGRGHTNVELERQAMRERSAKLERELESLRETRATQVARREGVPRVALVGYTNTGKSSILRALTGSDVFVQDALFATLEPTVRALSPETTPRILIADTVGFVRNLPHSLVRSFHSTLDEAREADLLLLIVDASDPSLREQLAVTRDTLDAIGATAPTRIVLNKIDRVDAEMRAALAREFPDAIAISAHDAADVARLRAAIIAFFERSYERDVLVVPFTASRLLAEIRAEAHVSSEQYDENGAVLTVRARRASLERWRSQLPERPLPETPGDVLAAARRYGLKLTLERDGLDETGLDFLVVHARDDAFVPWIVRSPRRPSVVEAAQREARVLALVRDVLPVTVPDWRLCARDVIAYPRLPGVVGSSVDWFGAPGPASERSSAPDVFVRGVADVLTALHRIAPSRAYDAGVRVEGIEDVRRDLRRAMERVRPHLDPPERVWSRWRRWIDDDASWPDRTALVHGDLHAGHLLLHPDGGVAGIIDWTEARVSDPGIDLAMIAGCFGRSALEKIVEHLEQAGGVIWPRIVEHAMERWAVYPVVVAEWALRTGHEMAMEHARRHLASVAAETQ